MKEKNNLLVILVSVLIIAVLGQMLLLWKMHNRLERRALKRQQYIAQSPEPFVKHRNFVQQASRPESRKPMPPSTAKMRRKPMGRPIDMDPFFDDPWDPIQEFDQLQREVNRLFSRRAGKMSVNGIRIDDIQAPQIQHKDKEVIVTLRIPRLHQQKLKIDIDDQTLIIKGTEEGSSEEDSKNGELVQKSSFSRSFVRKFTLPVEIEEDSLKIEKSGSQLRLLMQEKE